MSVTTSSPVVWHELSAYSTALRYPPAERFEPKLSPSQLSECLPLMRPMEWIDRKGLSDDGFCDSLAHLPLSRTTAVTLEIEGMSLSHRAIGQLDLAMHQAWDIAADNVLRAAHTPHGTRFWTRPVSQYLGPEAPCGVQLRSTTVPATSWLAHPYLAHTVHTHLSELLETDSLVYLAPQATVLLVLADVSISDATMCLRLASEHASRFQPPLCKTPLTISHGFPSEMLA